MMMVVMCFFSAIAASKERKQIKGSEQDNNTTLPGANCCVCPKSKEELKLEERERQIEIEFENYLHDHVYCKRSGLQVLYRHELETCRIEVFR